MLAPRATMAYWCPPQHHNSPRLSKRVPPDWWRRAPAQTGDAFDIPPPWSRQSEHTRNITKLRGRGDSDVHQTDPESVHNTPLRYTADLHLLFVLLHARDWNANETTHLSLPFRHGFYRHSGKPYKIRFFGLSHRVDWKIPTFLGNLQGQAT